MTFISQSQNYQLDMFNQVCIFLFGQAVTTQSNQWTCIFIPLSEVKIINIESDEQAKNIIFSFALDAHFNKLHNLLPEVKILNNK